MLSKFHAITRLSFLAGLIWLCSNVQVIAHEDAEDHVHQHKHQTTHDSARFVTNRKSQVQLPLPVEEGMFTFVIFGDRTGGPSEGIQVLKQAVKDTNLLEPDLVMTVGDLVEGYNQTDEWLEQMKEYKQVMNNLVCPWFPVAGNHDIYWRGPNKPVGEHETNYEMHFGPLWYAFEHKNCWFIVLFSDEGDPQTEEKTFKKSSAQRMSPEQFQWLKNTLAKTRDAEHVFVFLHHPRWLRGRYGNDWDRVHTMLAANGNVSAVFAGHIHHMRYEGKKDGIEYMTLAKLGGVSVGSVPEAGYLDQFHLVTVRKDQIAMASLPVGEVQDVRKITGKTAIEARQLSRVKPIFDGPMTFSFEESDATYDANFSFTNPTSRPIELTLWIDSEDNRWISQPDHIHQIIKPEQTYDFKFHLSRMGNPGLDQAVRAPEIIINNDYLAEGLRVSLPQKRVSLPLKVTLPASDHEPNHALDLRNSEDYVAVNLTHPSISQGPLTLECWFNAKSFGSRTGLVTKTENSEFGIFVSNGIPSFFIHLNGRYVSVRGSEKLRTDRWHHIAGVYDGSEVRLYVDGKKAAAKPGSGKRKENKLPLLIGADPNRMGVGGSHFDGLIDAVRLSSSAAYHGNVFQPEKKLNTDQDTQLLIDFDKNYGLFFADRSSNRITGHYQGKQPVLVKP